MNTGAVQAFPTVVVTMNADGAAHLNVTGTHIDYEPASPDETRAAVIRDVAQIAAHLKRPVRMKIDDPAGSWLVAVAPDGHVTELVTVDTRAPRRKIKPAAAPAPAPAAPAVAPLPFPTPPPEWPVRSQWAEPSQLVATVPPAPAAPVLPASPVPTQPAAAAPEPPAARSALLTFRNGQTVVVNGRTLVGRSPVAPQGETFDQVVSIADTGRTISKTHFHLEWTTDGLWITDRGSANGVRVEHGGGSHVDLQSLTPHMLEHGDTVNLGTETFTVHLDHPATA